MSIFAVRDDDTSFFTCPDELDLVYGSYWGKVPISLSVVPFSVPKHRLRSLASGYVGDAEVPLDANRELILYLRSKLKRGEAEVMLHGYNHQYKYINRKWVGECLWKDERQLTQEVMHGKKYLERVLDTRIRVFVPPSNSIGIAGIKAIRKAGLSLSGIMGRGGDRPLSWDYCMAYWKRWLWRFSQGIPYPYPVRYGGHTELCAHSLTPSVAKTDLLRVLDICCQRKAPFVVATHYWEFENNSNMHKILDCLITKAVHNGMKLGNVYEVMGERM